MAAPNITSATSFYSLVLAYAVIVLSAWKVDMGLVGRPGLTSWGGDSAVVTRLAATAAGDESRSEVFRLLASLFELSDATPRRGNRLLLDKVRTALASARSV